MSDQFFRNISFIMIVVFFFFQNYDGNQSVVFRQANLISFLLDLNSDFVVDYFYFVLGLIRFSIFLEMFRQGYILDYIVDLFDDVQKIFERYLRFDVNDLSVGFELLSLEYVIFRDGDRVIFVKDITLFIDEDFSSEYFRQVKRFNNWVLVFQFVLYVIKSYFNRIGY